MFIGSSNIQKQFEILMKENIVSDTENIMAGWSLRKLDEVFKADITVAENNKVHISPDKTSRKLRKNISDSQEEN